MVEVQKSPQPAAPQITNKKNGARFKRGKSQPVEKQLSEKPLSKGSKTCQKHAKICR